MKKRIDAGTIKEDYVTRKFLLTEPSVYFFSAILTSLGKNQKEKSIVVVRCIEEFYEFAKKQSGDFSKIGNPDAENNHFLQITSINLIEKTENLTTIYIRLPNKVVSMLDEMSAYVDKVVGFNSSSSIVNHAISFRFDQIDGAIEEYLLKNDVRIPG